MWTILWRAVDARDVSRTVGVGESQADSLTAVLQTVKRAVEQSVREERRMRGTDRAVQLLVTFQCLEQAWLTSCESVGEREG